MPSQTATEIRDRLANVRASIDAIVQGRVAEFGLDHGDRARTLSLRELRDLENELARELRRLERGVRPRFIRGQRI